MRLLLAPHSDDECLFAAYTIMRHKPVVVVCTSYDGGRGPSANDRYAESFHAMSELGATVRFMGMKESLINELDLFNLIKYNCNDDMRLIDCIYAPDIRGGHAHHDIVSSVAKRLGEAWDIPIIYYATYTKDSLKPFGDIEIVPTEAEFQLKKRALACYKSQWKLNPQHFEAVLEARSEFYVS